MKQKKLVITVYDSNGEVIFSKDPAVPDHVASVLALYAEIGNEICIAIREYEPSES